MKADERTLRREDPRDVTKDKLAATAVSLTERYERHPVVRALVRLIPYASVAEAAVLTVVANVRRDRARVFFDELASANAIDNPELLESEDFVHCFFSTAKFALNTRRREKIRMFARLLKRSTLTDGGLSDVDEYEDFLRILDELSYRELRALDILDSFCDTDAACGQNEMEQIMGFWDAFCLRLSAELDIPHDEVPDFMSRIGRTGCLQEHVGWDATTGMGKLTPTYRRLREFVQAEV